MFETYFPSDNGAPVFGRQRDTNRPAVYWKCHIGRRIHLARERAQAQDASAGKLTREELGRRVGMSALRIWEIEQGLLAIDGSEIALLAEALNIHPGFLFDDSAWQDWVPVPCQAPSWMLAKTIAALGEVERGILEYLVLHFDARKHRQAA